jgi:hypothetical protein
LPLQLLSAAGTPDLKTGALYRVHVRASQGQIGYQMLERMVNRQTR